MQSNESLPGWQLQIQVKDAGNNWLFVSEISLCSMYMIWTAKEPGGMGDTDRQDPA
jgi:hypothetical protein